MSCSQRDLLAQVRLVVQSLTVPAPQILAVMEEVERLDLTQVQLPIVEFSPFAVLSLPQPAARNDTSERQSRRVTPSASLTQAVQRQEAAALNRDAADHPTPPVFSLRPRTGGQSNKAEVRQAQSLTPSDSATVDTSEIPRRQQGTASETATPMTESQEGHGEFSPAEKPQLPPLTEQASSTANSAALSWLEFATQALNEIHQAGSSRETGLASNERSQNEMLPQRSQAVRSENNETVSRNGAVNDGVPLSPLGHRAQHRDEQSSSVISHTRMMTQHVPVARLGSVSIPADRINNAPTSQFIPQAESLSHITLDAEEIAALVNDTLVEQARRNGVDLS